MRKPRKGDEVVFPKSAILLDQGSDMLDRSSDMIRSGVELHGRVIRSEVLGDRTLLYVRLIAPVTLWRIRNRRARTIKRILLWVVADRAKVLTVIEMLAEIPAQEQQVAGE